MVRLFLLFCRCTRVCNSIILPAAVLRILIHLFLLSLVRMSYCILFGAQHGRNVMVNVSVPVSVSSVFDRFFSMSHKTTAKVVSTFAAWLSFFIWKKFWLSAIPPCSISSLLLLLSWVLLSSDWILWIFSGKFKCKKKKTTCHLETHTVLHIICIRTHLKMGITLWWALMVLFLFCPDASERWIISPLRHFPTCHHAVAPMWQPASCSSGVQFHCWRQKPCHGRWGLPTPNTHPLYKRPSGQTWLVVHEPEVALTVPSLAVLKPWQTSYVLKQALDKLLSDPEMHSFQLFFLTALLIWATQIKPWSHRGKTAEAANEFSSSNSEISAEVAAYADVAKQIIDLAVFGAAQNRSYNRLAHFTDTIGSRVSGSRSLEMAIKYMYSAMTQDGLDVHLGKETGSRIRIRQDLIWFQEF